MTMRTTVASDEHTDRPAGPVLAWLDDEAATEVAAVGAKAANLARSAAHHLPVLPGFALTVEGTEAWPVTQHRPEIRAAWEQLSNEGTSPLVVRSSSVVEDAESSSMAGRFTSVLDVQGWEAFVAAVDEVLASAADVGDEPAPMGVVVQPLLEPDRAGVAFGANPVDGSDELLVAVVQGGPDALVSGIDGGETLRLSPRGRIHPDHGAAPSEVLSRHERHQLAHLIRQLDRYFGGPQDIEWAIDHQQRLWLLQTRPITTDLQPALGPRLGPGPVAESFPRALSTLEEDLWVPGLRDGITEAVALSGAHRRSRVQRSPVVVSIRGRLAVDLELFGIEDDGHRWWRALDPRIGGSHLAAAWRVGRLRVAIADLADRLVRTTDAQLAEVGRLDDLDDEDLLAILANTRRSLTALHGHEVLAGMLLPDAAVGTSAAGIALATLRRAQAAGLSDAEVVRRHPIVLGLVPPRIGPGEPLPTPGPEHRTPASTAPESESGGDTDRTAVAREALRLRVRWVQELSARAAWTLADHLTAAGVLTSAEQVRRLHLDELVAAVRTGRAPSDLPERRDPEDLPLPAVFRLRADGSIVALRSEAGDAQGAGGGRAQGPVHLGDDPPPGSVLVVRTLDPRLATVLDRLQGLVAETGSPLSHLAILAREMGVATVVGQADATTTFEEGEVLVVDGVTGEVQRVASPDDPTRSEPGRPLKPGRPTEEEPS